MFATRKEHDCSPRLSWKLWELGPCAGRMTLPPSQTWIAAVRRTFASLGWMVVMCSVVWASGPNDVPANYSINLSVIDEKNQPVSNATVEIRVNGKALSTSTTSAAGKVTLAVKTAGSYSLNIQKKGYLPLETALEVSESNRTQDIDVVLSESALSEQSVVVKGEASNPVTDTTSSPTTLAPSKAKDTPLRPATVVDALPLIPGIVRAPDGSVRIAGFGEDHSALLVNSVDVTDPATGGFGLSVPIDSVQTIEVSEMPYLAQYGRFTAGVVAAETRRGGDKWDYSLNDPFPDFFIRSAHLEGVRDASPRFNVSGPIIANRLYFLEGRRIPAE